MIITQTDLGTHLYPEVINEITRADNTIAERAIAAAVQETKIYLARYDLTALFGTDTADATVQDDFLKTLVKDIACWHLLRLANVNVNYGTFRTGYEDALATLKTIMGGAANPQGWPYADTTGETTPQGDSISWSSNPKRNNFY